MFLLSFWKSLRVDINSSLNVQQNSPVKLSVLNYYFLRVFFLTTESITLLIIGLPIFYFFLIQFGKVYVSRNLSISSKLFNFGAVIVHHSLLLLAFLCYILLITFKKMFFKYSLMYLATLQTSAFLLHSFENFLKLEYIFI